MKVFWSWQSDFAPKECRHFIKASLQDAIDTVAQELTVEESDRPELDHDTKGEAGMVDIAQTILRKIGEASVFVADVTPIGSTADKKALPNPNVMIELGWAMHRPGIARVIPILNTASGFEIADLPFDIRHRRVMAYNLSSGADADIRGQQKRKLTEKLVDAVRTNLLSVQSEKASSAAIAHQEVSGTDRSIWTSESIIAHSSIFGSKQYVRIESSPRSYLRVAPQYWTSGKPRATLFDNSNDLTFYPVVQGSANGSRGVMDDGFLWYWHTHSHREHPNNGTSALGAYLDTFGEFWLADGTVFYGDPEHVRFFLPATMNAWHLALGRAIELLHQLGASGGARVEVGLFGIKDSVMQYGIREAGSARRNHVAWTYQQADWSEANRVTFLTAACAEIMDAYGLKPLPDADARRLIVQGSW